MKKSLRKNRCWKGYKPVKGKRPYSKGSCRKVRRNAKGDARRQRESDAFYQKYMGPGGALHGLATREELSEYENAGYPERNAIQNRVWNRVQMERINAAKKAGRISNRTARAMVRAGLPLSRSELRGNRGLTPRQQKMLDFLKRVYPQYSELAKDSATKKDASRLARLKLIKVRSFKRTGTSRGKRFSMMIMEARAMAPKGGQLSSPYLGLAKNPRRFYNTPGLVNWPDRTEPKLSPKELLYKLEDDFAVYRQDANIGYYDMDPKVVMDFERKIAMARKLVKNSPLRRSDLRGNPSRGSGYVDKARLMADYVISDIGNALRNLKKRNHNDEMIESFNIRKRPGHPDQAIVVVKHRYYVNGARVYSAGLNTGNTISNLARIVGTKRKRIGNSDYVFNIYGINLPKSLKRMPGKLFGNPKSFPNIDKSGFHKGQYVGYSPKAVNVFSITRDYRGWKAIGQIYKTTPKESLEVLRRQGYPGVTTKIIYGKDLAEISNALENL